MEETVGAQAAHAVTRCVGAKTRLVNADDRLRPPAKQKNLPSLKSDDVSEIFLYFTFSFSSTKKPKRWATRSKMCLSTRNDDIPVCQREPRLIPVV